MSEDFRMSMSPSIGKIAEALAKAQLAMRPAVRDATNPAFKRDGTVSRYATLASCIEALRPLHENGIAVVQPPASHGPDGVCVSTLLLHSSGEWIRGELYMPAQKKDAQGFGSALSYARRYCLTATVGLGTDDDDGESAVRQLPAKSGAPAAPKGEPNATEQAIADMFASARSVEDVAAAEAAAAKAISDRRVVNGGRERLLKARAATIARLEGR